MTATSLKTKSSKAEGSILDSGSNSLPLPTTSATFSFPLYPSEIPYFRGAIIEQVMKLKEKFRAMDIETDLFHNENEENFSADYHQVKAEMLVAALEQDIAAGNSMPDENQGNGQNGHNKKGHYLHRLPLIQYQVSWGKASLFGYGKGAEAINFFLALRSQVGSISFGRRHRDCSLSAVQSVDQLHTLALGTKLHSYRISYYVPFNSDNYKEYKSLKAIQMKALMLQRVLRNQLVAWIKSTGFDLPQDCGFEVEISDINRVKKVNCLGTPSMAFDLDFRTNITLPDRLGIGRSSAFGFGWIKNF